MQGWSSKDTDSFVAIPVHVYNIDGGITVPQLDQWFTAPYRILSEDLISYSGTRMRVFYQLATGMSRISLSTTELVVFPRHGVVIETFNDPQRDLIDVRSVVERWVICSNGVIIVAERLNRFLTLPDLRIWNRPFLTNVECHVSTMHVRCLKTIRAPI